MRKVRFIGLDVHADTIAVAIAEPSGDVRSVGGDSQPARVDPQAGEEAGAGRAIARLLRGGAHGVCRVLATDRTRRAVRGGGAHLGAREARRSRQDGPARRAETGAELPRGRLDARLGARRGPRSLARPRARQGGREERPVARAASAREVPAPAWASTAHGDQGLDAAPSDVGEERRAFRGKRRRRPPCWITSTKWTMWPGGSSGSSARSTRPCRRRPSGCAR